MNFIERILGISPDGDSGVLEIALVLVISTVIFLRHARRIRGSPLGRAFRHSACGAGRNGVPSRTEEIPGARYGR